LETSRIEANRIEAAREADRLEANRIEDNRIEANRIEAAREADRLETNRIEANRVEAAREADRLETSRIEANRIEANRVEAAREAGRLEADRLESIRVEAAREAELLIASRLEASRIESNRADAARETERADARRIEEYRIEADRIDSARRAEMAEQSRLETIRRLEIIEAERLAASNWDMSRTDAAFTNDDAPRAKSPIDLEFQIAVREVEELIDARLAALRADVTGTASTSVPPADPDPGIETVRARVAELLAQPPLHPGTLRDDEELGPARGDFFLRREGHELKLGVGIGEIRLDPNTANALVGGVLGFRAFGNPRVQKIYQKTGYDPRCMVYDEKGCVLAYRALKGCLKGTGCDANHLLPGEWFKKGPANLQALYEYVPAVPLMNGAEHQGTWHAGWRDGNNQHQHGVNAWLAGHGLFKQPGYSVKDIDRGLDLVQKWYESQGSVEPWTSYAKAVAAFRKLIYEKV
jgi:hypothetical protein